SVTGLTRDVIVRVRKQGAPVHLTGFAAPISNDAADLAALAKQYRSAGLPIALEVIDPDLQPGKARAAHIDSQGEAVVEMGGRQERLTPVTQRALTSA